MRCIGDGLRIVVVLLGVIAAAGSAGSSHPPPAYAPPQQPQAQHAPAPPAPASQPLMVQPAAPAGEIAVDYDVPADYMATKVGSNVVFVPAPLDKMPCAYGLSPPRASSGSLERDAAAALLEPHPEWQRKDDRYSAMRGTSGAGWQYFWLRADAMKPGPSHEYKSVMAMAFSGGNNQVNVLWGFGNPARCLLDDASFARLFHGLRPHGWRSDGGQALARELVGLWRTSQRVGTGQYRFTANGRYELGSSTTTQAGASQRTSTSTHEGGYTLRDATLVFTPDQKSHGTEQRRIRIYDEYVGGRWTRTLAMLDDRPDATGEVLYYRIDETK